MSCLFGKHLVLAMLAVFGGALAAQNPPVGPTPASPSPAPRQPAHANEAEVVKQVIALLVAFARQAESTKMPARAREVYEQLLAHYDSDNPTARAGLGEKKVRGEWRQVTPKESLPANSNTAEQQRAVEDAWNTTRKRAGKLHRELGIALLAAGEEPRGRAQLERAIAFAADDAEAHRALGHVEFDGFFGTEREIAFVRRMREIFVKARAIADADVRVEAVDGPAPQELLATGYAFAGARSEHVTFWVLGTPEEAAKCAMWYERGGRLLEFLLGEGEDARARFNWKLLRWIGVLRTDEQQLHLLEVSPSTRGRESLERARMYGGNWFDSKTGRAAWRYHDQEWDADFAVATITKRGTPSFNSGFSEGLVHAMTWLLVGTCESFYMQLPQTASGQGKRERDPATWLRLLREQVDAGTDWPLVQIPRERMDNFRDEVRMKSWSFVLWLIARHPDRWSALLQQIGKEQRTTEAVEQLFAEVLECELGEAESEWRAWVRRGSAIGKASGLPW